MMMPCSASGLLVDGSSTINSTSIRSYFSHGGDIELANDRLLYLKAEHAQASAITAALPSQVPWSVNFVLDHSAAWPPRGSLPMLVLPSIADRLHASLGILYAQPFSSLDRE